MKVSKNKKVLSFANNFAKILSFAKSYVILANNKKPLQTSFLSQGLDNKTALKRICNIFSALCITK